MKSFILISCLLYSLCSLPTYAQDTALLEAEQARGLLTGDNGVQWTVSVTGNNNARFIATSQDGKVYAEVFEPEEAKGRKYLAEAKGNMWFWKPGLSRPVSVSKRQRLSGDAAIGDIASTSFVKGYKVVSQEEADFEGEAATIYTMKSNSLTDTYAQIKYWVIKEGNLGKYTEFYAKSGTLLRSCTMEYHNSANERPFLSKMVINDNTRSITLSFSDVKIATFPQRMFERDYLGGPKPKRPGK